MKMSLVAVLFTACLASVVVMADSDEESEWFWRHKSTFVTNEVYINECGDCHMAYPAFLLPSASWDKLMNRLDDHFGDNAELSVEDETIIREYLSKNAADKSGARLGKKIVRAGDVAMQISKSRYIKNKHRGELPRDVFTSGKVESLSQCDACHKHAVSGSFREREIDIPGYGRWDD